jgi:putative tricarboxylic transport membrane protein
MIEQLVEGLLLSLRPDVIGVLIVGATLGVVIGALPGLTAAMAVAVLLPIAFFVEPVLGIPFLLAITKGAIFGGSIPAILLNTPGTGAAAATVLDGYPLARQGKARKALELALYSSAIGDTFSDIVTIFVAGAFAAIALLVGPPEYFAIFLFSFAIISCVTGNSVIRGLMAAALGLFISSIGLDPLNGVQRFTFGSVDMSGGISFIAMIIGIFALSEVFLYGEKSLRDRRLEEARSLQIVRGKGNPPLTLREFRDCGRTIARSAVVGTVIGTIPGIGQVVSAFVCYALAKRRSKEPERFGKGSLEGVAAAETGNNAVNGSSLIPLLSFGIPGDVVTAVLFAAFMIQGLRPGPRLFEDHGAVVYSILFAMLLCNVVLLLIGFLSLRYVALIAQVPRRIIFPVMAALCVVGSFALNNSLFDVQVLLFFGVVGYFLRKFDFPLAPLIITFILGRQFESSLGQSLILGDGNLTIFLSRPISLAFIVLAAGILVWGTRRRSPVPAVGEERQIHNDSGKSEPGANGHQPNKGDLE